MVCPTISMSHINKSGQCFTPPFSLSLSHTHTHILTDTHSLTLAPSLSLSLSHSQCGGYVDDEGEIVEDSALEEFPSSANDFWSIFLQFPVLSWMDVARKRQVMQRISEVAVAGGCAVEDYRDFCVANVETFDVAEYRES